MRKKTTWKQRNLNISRVVSPSYNIYIIHIIGLAGHGLFQIQRDRENRMSLCLQIHSLTNMYIQLLRPGISKISVGSISKLPDKEKMLLIINFLNKTKLSINIYFFYFFNTKVCHIFKSLVLGSCATVLQIFCFWKKKKTKMLRRIKDYFLRGGGGITLLKRRS